MAVANRRAKQNTLLGNYGLVQDARPGPTPEERVRQTAARLGWTSGDLPDIHQFRTNARARRVAVRRMLSDEAVKGGLLEKVFGVGQLSLQVKPANKDNPLAVQGADFVRFVIEDRLPYGVPGLVETIGLPALLEDHSLSEPVWPAVGVLETDEPWRGKRALFDVKSRHPNSYRLQEDTHGTTVGVEYQRDDGGIVVDDPASFIIFSYLRLWSSNLSGYTDVEGAYNHFVTKWDAIRLRAILEDRFSGGFLKIIGDPNDQVLKDTAAAARSMGYIILAPGSDAEVLDLAGSAQDIFRNGIEDRNKAIWTNFSGAYLHAMESTQSNPRGNSRVALSGSELRQIHFATALSTSALTRQLAPIILAENLPAAPRPKVILAAIDMDYVERDLKIGALVKSLVGPENVGMEQVYERSGWNPPRNAKDKLPPEPVDPFGGLPGQGNNPPKDEPAAE